MKTIRTISWVLFFAIAVFVIVAPLFQTRDFDNIQQKSGVSKGFYAKNNTINYIVVDSEKYFLDPGSPVPAVELYQLLGEGAKVELWYIANSHIIVALEVDGNQKFTVEQYKQHFNQWRTATPIRNLCLFAIVVPLVFFAQKLHERKHNSIDF
ncbi:MAG: hypothetical protein IJD18_03755 [Clostridia bacterium]|nr:hypothetical protein [Clostridia bacterium]